MAAFAPLAAQHVTGHVADEEGAPLAYANVVALSLPDSAFVAGAITSEDGTFAFDVPQQGQLLRFSSVGYETRYVQRAERMGTVTLHPYTDMLDEVVVKASLPKTRMKGDAMLTTVAGSVLEKAGSMEQLLDRIPNVTAFNGDIQVFGRGTPEIYINGRKMRNQMELERLNADNIKSVEVITNPGARYNADVTSVIRITTKRVEGEGFGFDARATFNHNNYDQWGETGRFNFNYRRGGFDLTGTLYLSDNERVEDKYLEQIAYLAQPGSAEQTWRQGHDIYSRYKWLNPYGQLSANYMFNPNHSIGANFGYDRYAIFDGVTDVASGSYLDNSLTETSTSLITATTPETTMNANFYYTGKLGDWSIDFNTDWYWDKVNETTGTQESYGEEGQSAQQRDVNTRNLKRSQLVASKLVLSAPLWGGQLELGGEYSHSQRKTTYTVLPTGLIDDDHSRIEEGMTSAFVQYNRRIGSVNLQAGLRYEHTNFDYYEDEQYVDEQSRVFDNVFPSLSLSTTIGNVDLQLGYASDISRPSYWDLRSSILYANRYTYETGNPFLVPTISNNVSLGAAWKWASFNAVYSHISDPILQFCEDYNGDPSVSLLTKINGDAYDKLDASLTLHPKFGIWSPSLTMAVSKQWYDMEVHGGASLNHAIGTFRFNNTFDTKWITLSLLMNASTEGNMGEMRMMKGMFRTDLSLYKTILKGFTAQLDIRDLFCTQEKDVFFYYGTRRSMYYNECAQRNIQLTLRYKFNVAKSKYKGSGAGQGQLQRM